MMSECLRSWRHNLTCNELICIGARLSSDKWFVTERDITSPRNWLRKQPVIKRSTIISAAKNRKGTSGFFFFRKVSTR